MEDLNVTAEAVNSQSPGQAAQLVGESLIPPDCRFEPCSVRVQEATIPPSVLPSLPLSLTSILKIFKKPLEENTREILYDLGLGNGIPFDTKSTGNNRKKQIN